MSNKQIINMIINCKNISESLKNRKIKSELFTINKNRVCLYYTDVIKYNNRMYIEIPMCAIDIAFMIPDMRSNDVILLNSRDRSIKHIEPVMETKGQLKEGYVYIESRKLYRIS